MYMYHMSFNVLYHAARPTHTFRLSLRQLRPHGRA